MVTAIILFLLIAACAVILVMGFAPDPSRQAIRQRLATELSVEEDEGGQPKKSSLARTLDVMEPINRSAKLDKFKQRIGRHLESGHVRLNALEFLALQELVAVVTVASYIVWSGSQVNWMVMIVAGAVAFVLPDLWLRQHIKTRKRAISRDLPEVVDLLTLCVDAGTDFMGALSRVVKEFRPCPLLQELVIVLREIRVGKRRRDALRSLAKRVEMPEISSFVRTLIQADRMGTGIAEALRIQSEESRMRRYHYGERLAQQAPLKMLIPLVFCILPCVGIIVAGPVLLQFLKGDLIPKM